MNRLAAMLDRLPPIYTTEAGSLLHQVLSLLALLQACYDEDLDRVQRSHWIDSAFDRVDLERMGALFELPPASWEPDGLYRERLKATIGARLEGAVTRPAQERVLLRVLDRAQQELGLRFLDPAPRGVPSPFHDGPARTPDEPAFVEFPVRARRQLEGDRAAIRPFDRVELENRGLEPAPLSITIQGAPGRRTVVPTIVHLDSQRVVAWAGRVRCGETLKIEASARGQLTATLDGADMSDRLITGTGYDPSRSDRLVQPDEAATAIELPRGKSTLWFFPLALYDRPGLDVMRLASPAPELDLGGARHPPAQGTWAPTSGEMGPPFGAAVFYEDPFLYAELGWTERTPATYRFEVPSGAVRADQARSDRVDVDRQRIFALLQGTLSLLRAASIQGSVQARPFREEVPLTDRVVLPVALEHVPDGGGDDELSALSAIFDLTARHGSRFG